MITLACPSFFGVADTDGNIGATRVYTLPGGRKQGRHENAGRRIRLQILLGLRFLEGTWGSCKKQSEVRGPGSEVMRTVVSG